MSLNCVSHVCQPATCSDGIKNGGEGDEDCGGPCPAKCAIGMQCGGASDCVAGAHSSAACVSGTCGLGTCTSGFASCDGVAQTGCETDTRVDARHCGTCFHDCDAGACLAGLCQPYPLGTTTGNLFHPGLSTTHVYWTNKTNRLVQRVAKAGGPVETVATAVGEPEGLEVDTDAVFWTDAAINGGVYRADLDGSNPVTISSTENIARTLTVDTQYVYWTAEGSGQIRRAAKSGAGSPTTLVTGADTPYQIALDATHLYWTSRVGGTLWRVPKAGGTPQLLGTRPTPANGISVGGGYVYWSTGEITTGTIQRTPIGGGATVTLASLQDRPYGVLLDPTSGYLYWGNINGNVVQFNVASSASRVLDSGTGLYLASDATRVYWTTFSDGIVRAMVK